MASQMAMRNMSPCEGVKPARGPDEACLRSPGGLNPVATHRWRANTNEVRASVPPEGESYPSRGTRCGWAGKEGDQRRRHPRLEPRWHGAGCGIR